MKVWCKLQPLMLFDRPVSEKTRNHRKSQNDKYGQKLIFSYLFHEDTLESMKLTKLLILAF